MTETTSTSSRPEKPEKNEWDIWAEAAQGGDHKAYESLLNALVPYIKKVVLPKLARPDAADDIVQEVLISLHKALPTYSPDRPFKPWLNAIISFRFTDYMRKHYARRGDKEVSDDVLAFDAENVTKPGAAGELKDIEAALNSLPARQRKIIELLKIQGFSINEVAEKMGMTASAVKVSAHRSVNKLKNLLH